MKRGKIILIILTAFCFALRLAFITQKNLWFDEIYSWHISLGSVSDIIIDTSSDIHPPFYYFVLKFWNILAGDSVLSMRLLSAIFSTASIYFIYKLSRFILDAPGSLVVLLLYTLSPLNLFYSQEVRMSALNLFLNLAAVYSFIRLLPEVNIRGLYRNKYIYFYFLFTVTAIYTHYFSFMIIAAEILFVIYKFIKSGKYLLFITLFIIPVLSYLPWYKIMLAQTVRGQQWRNPRGVGGILNEILNYTRDVMLGLYYSNVNSKIITLITFSIFVLIVITAIFLLKKIKEGREQNYKFFFVALIIIPLFCAVIISFNQRIEYFRYLSILIPYIIIVYVSSVLAIRYKPIAIICIISFAVINIFGIGLHYSKNYKNNDYREIISTIERNYLPGDEIYVEPHYYRWILDYYRKQDGLKMSETKQYGWGMNMMIHSLKDFKPQSFWLIVDYSSLDTLNYNGYINEIKTEYSQVYLKRFRIIPNDVELYKFKISN